MMLIAVFFGHLFALFSEVLFESRVDDQFLTNGVASQFPGELVAEALLVVMVVCVVYHFVVILSKLTVVFSDGIGNAGRMLGHDAVYTIAGSGCCEAVVERYFGGLEGN